MRVVLFLVLASGCGRIHFAPLDDAGGGDDGASLDGPPPFTSPCMPFGAGWGIEIPRRVEVSQVGAAEQQPFVTVDGLTLYFVRDDDIVVSTRAYKGAVWSVPVAVPELSSPLQESGVFLTDNQLEAYVSTRRAGSQNSDIWRATRAAVSDAFSGIQVVANVSTDGFEYEPSITSDGLRMYFTRENVPGGGGGDPVVSIRATTAQPWGAAMLVSPMASANNEYGFSLSADELIAMVSSDRTMPGGNADLYIARRSTTQVELPMAMPFMVLNSAADDGHPSITADGCEIYFASNRDGDFDLWVSLWRPI